MGGSTSKWNDDILVNIIVVRRVKIRDTVVRAFRYGLASFIKVFLLVRTEYIIISSVARQVTNQAVWKYDARASVLYPRINQKIIKARISIRDDVIPIIFINRDIPLVFHFFGF